MNKWKVGKNARKDSYNVLYTNSYTVKPHHDHPPYLMRSTPGNCQFGKESDFSVL